MAWRDPRIGDTLAVGDRARRGAATFRQLIGWPWARSACIGQAEWWRHAARMRVNGMRMRVNGAVEFLAHQRAP